MKEQWQGFKGSKWKDEVDVRDFIQNNYKPYNGDESFLEGPKESTNTLWAELQKLQKEERAKGGVLDMETEVVSSLTAYGPGYLDKDLEKVVGLQTDKPLKRAFMPYGGIRMSEEACETYGYKPSEKLHEIFTKYHKTHNDAVFSAYTPEMRLARRNKIVTGLPDTYGRGRIVGDYRRVALYGIDYLIEQKQKDLAYCGDGTMTDDVIRQREELAEQIKALKEMKIMAASYGYDISQPAKNSLEAVQWLYFGYLAAIKTQNGAAMSVGRISTFLDIYFERDLENGVFTESEIQEIVDHVTMKFRMESVIKQEDLGDYPVYGANGIIKKINNYEIEYPSIAIVKDGSGVGKMFKLSGKYSILSTLNYLTSKPGYDIDYIYYALKQKSLKKYVVGSGIPHIYFKDYEQEKIYIPQNELQQQNITSVLQSIDEEIGNEIKQLKNYELLKKYLLKNMFV